MLFFYKKNKRGFTLLELLVVIGIISILSALVFFVVRDARIRGADAGIISNLKAIPAQAELFYLDNGNKYTFNQSAHGSGGLGSYCSISYQPTSPFLFARDETIHRAIYESVKLMNFPSGINSAFVNRTRCFNNPKSYAIAISLRSGYLAPFKSWCIDSSGNAKIVPYVPAQAFSIVGTDVYTRIATCR